MYIIYIYVYILYNICIYHVLVFVYCSSCLGCCGATQVSSGEWGFNTLELRLFSNKCWDKTLKDACCLQTFDNVSGSELLGTPVGVPANSIGCEWKKRVFARRPYLKMRLTLGEAHSIHWFKTPSFLWTLAFGGITLYPVLRHTHNLLLVI